jgi:hypothetical protein
MKGKKPVQRNSLNALFLVLLAIPAAATAQVTGTGTTSSAGTSGGYSSGSASLSGNSQTDASSSTNGTSAAGSRDPQDDISDVAPPFNVEDVLRMHRVGLQDEVIINALRARYHPFKLTAGERDELEKNSISEAVIEAIEDPLAEKVATHSTPPLASPAPLPKTDSKAAPDAKATAAVEPSASPRDTPGGASGSVPTGVANDAPKVASGVASTPNSTPGPTKMSAANMPDYTRTSAQLKTPDAPGVYRRVTGGGWALVATESITWRHSSGDSARGVKGLLAGKACGTATTPAAADFLIVTKPDSSIVQFQLLQVHAAHQGREFIPSEDGDAYGGDHNPEAIPYDPRKLGAKVWLVSLHNLPEGDYGFLPPNQSDLRSTTGFAGGIYTFHVL